MKLIAVNKYLSKHNAMMATNCVSRKQGHFASVRVTHDSRKTSNPNALGSM